MLITKTVRKMNKNFKHKYIATRGCSALGVFLNEQKREGWHTKFHRGLAGVDPNMYYYFHPTGFLQAVDALPVDYVLVAVSSFTYMYKGMLAPTEQKEVREKVYKTTHAEMGKIYRVACGAWQDKLAGWCKSQLFNEALTFTESQVKQMFEASDKSQLAVVKSVFPDYAPVKELDLRKMKFDGEVFAKDGIEALVSIDITTFKSFILNPEYTWELGQTAGRFTTLTPTKKH